ncbi:uncharacterized protein [Paramisgurnus dabryanus]|uniref:uncharacterized protein isoform X1 n=1 Tax=Paramisgurnus dabryanus TaxID=90735 RepID=UPI0031F3384A
MTEMDSENNKKESKRKKLAPDSGSRGIYIPLSEFTNLSLITNPKDTNIQKKNTKPKEEKRLVLIDGEPTFQNQDNDQNLSGKTSQVVQHDNETNNAALVFEILNKETIKGPAVQSTYRLDRKRCQKARDDTNLLSNIASQYEDLNQEKLKDLEELCRLYVQGDYSKAYIYTGPLYHTKKDITKKEKKKIEERSKNGKALPTYFFKIIILEKDNGERELKCYEIPNEGKGQGQEKQQEIQHQKQQETQQQQNKQEKQQNQQQKQQLKLQQKQDKQQQKQEKQQQQQKQQEKHPKQEKQHQNQEETQQQKNQQEKQQQKLQEKLQQKQEKQQQKLQQKLQQKQEKQQQKLQQKQEKQREKQKQLQLQQQQKLQQKQEKQKEKLQQEQQKQQEKLQEKQEKEQQKLQQKLQQKQEKQQQKLQQKQEKQQEKQQQKLQQKQEKEQQKQQQKEEKQQEKQHEKLQQKQQEKPQHQKKVTIKDIENELSKFSRDIHYIEEVSGLTFTEKNQEILRKREEVMAVNFREDDKDTMSNPTHKIVETVKIIPKQNTLHSEV